MKKLINTSATYLIFALASGIFYREFTKINAFTGTTALSFMHVHLFTLGGLFFLILLLLEKDFHLMSHKHFNWFFILYNTGLVITTAAFLGRGIFQTLGTELSKAASASISGVGGIGHMALSAGLVFFILILRKNVLAQKS